MDAGDSLNTQAKKGMLPMKRPKGMAKGAIVAVPATINTAIDRSRQTGLAASALNSKPHL
jgi:hypothetical protein